MPAGYVSIGGLQVDAGLADLIAKEIAPPAGVSPEAFWTSFAAIVKDCAPINTAMLRKRDAIQAQIDSWLLQRAGQPWDATAYTAMLKQIGYIVPEGAPFKAATTKIDSAIMVPGPQLVVPVDNARYALNAANARWTSLLDAFYGTTAGPAETAGMEKGKSYNPKRGAVVFQYAQAVLDTAIPLASGKYDDVVKYSVSGGKFSATLKNGTTTGLKSPEKFLGYNEANGALADLLFVNNGLHIELVISKKGPGATHPASLSDIRIESACTAIMDMEDSVAAVDGADKTKVYRHWSRLMRGNLEAHMSKGGKKVVRKLNPDKKYKTPSGKSLNVEGRALMLVRHVGLHLYTDAVLDQTGNAIPENLLDCMVTALAAMPDLQGKTPNPNSYHGSMYAVRPKLHGPEEVAFVVGTFARVEKALGLPADTIKMGIMDEERRTTVNLYECIRAAQTRVAFINTGFLDRTGDEIHTSYYAGPMQTKKQIGGATWRLAYEDWNVDIGIKAGLLGIAQIGKGMWAKPDELGEMLKTKIAHPKAGASCAWVPSPTAATLHAVHYHQVDVIGVQKKLQAGGQRSKLSDILLPPLAKGAFTKKEILEQLKDSSQSILGYVVRWVENGVGCSKVPDIHDVGLMEDRATLRISSQHIANWIEHGVTTQEEVVNIMKEMAVIVDEQNKNEAGYKKMSPGFSNNAWLGALDLVLNGKDAANGYTEFGLTKWRRQEKSAIKSSL